MQLNLAPLEMNGATLEFAPLLPAIGMVWWHARRTTKALGNAVSVRGLRVFATLHLAIPLVITLIAWFMLWDASKVFDIAAPNLAVALLTTLLVNGASVVIGMGTRVWRVLLLRKGYATWPVEAIALANRFLARIIGAGAVVAVLYAVFNFRTLVDAYEITSNASGVIGLTVLSLLYVPNIAIGAASVLMGGEFHIGNGTFSYFAATNVNVPPTPLSAAVPNGEVPFAVLGFVVPVAVSLWVVYSFIRNRDYIESPILMGVGSGLAAAFMGFCVAWLAGGELGVYGHTGALAWLFALLSAAWLAVPTVAVMWWARQAGQAVVEDVMEMDTPDARATGKEPTEDQKAHKDKEESDDSGVGVEDNEDDEPADSDQDNSEETESEETEQDETDEDSGAGLGDGDSAAERD